METNDNNPKTVLSVRLNPRAKQKLVEEAEKLGTTLSEHAERILLNADNIRTDDDSERLRKENAALAQQVETLKAQLAILSDPELLRKFEQLKGMKDEVYSTDGKTYTITYNTPADLIWTTIHSFRLKQ